MTMCLRIWAAVLLAVLLAPMQARPEGRADRSCGCGQIPAIQAELARAADFQVQFQNKAIELKKSTLPEAERYIAFKAWAKGLGKKKSPGADPKEAVTAFVYQPVGQAELGLFETESQYQARESAWKIVPANAQRHVCDLAVKKSLEDFADSVSSCSGMKEDVIAHERFHVATCKTRGFYNYWFVRTADEYASEEAIAYRDNVSRLSDLLRSLLRDRQRVEVTSGRDDGSLQSLLALKTRCRDAWSVASIATGDLSETGVSCDGLFSLWKIKAVITTIGVQTISCDYEVLLARNGRGKYHYRCEGRRQRKPGVINFWTSSGEARATPVGIVVSGVEHELTLEAAPSKFWCTGTASCARLGVSVNDQTLVDRTFFIRRAQADECS